MIATIAIGGTRTAYLIDRHLTDGKIMDFHDYTKYSLHQYKRIIANYLSLEGQHLILPVYAWQLLIERGEKYAEVSVRALEMLITPEMSQFYSEYNIQPHFAGLEVLQMSSNPILRQVAENFQNFENQYQYSPDKHHLVWEIAPMPLLTFGQNSFPQKVTNTDDIAGLHDNLYKHYAKIAYKAQLTPPDIYIGSAKNGDLKIRSMFPMALGAGEDTRFYFLEYPSVLITKEHLRLIMEDARQAEYMKTYDYEDVMNEEKLNELKNRYQKMMEDNSILGITFNYEADIIKTSR